MGDCDRFREFVCDMTRLVDRAGRDEAVLLAEGHHLLSELVAHDDWLPDAFARPPESGYSQYLLHCDPLERFSVVSFVWGPGVATPVHDHTVWGLIGMLRGAETSTAFTRDPASGRLVPGETTRLDPGEIEAVSPTIGDIHVVRNAHEDRPSISIHVYGANIGAVRRHTFCPETGAPSAFVSGYTNAVCPNIWDRSAEMRALA